MKQSCYSRERAAFALRQDEAGMPVPQGLPQDGGALDADDAQLDSRGCRSQDTLGHEDDPGNDDRWVTHQLGRVRLEA